MPKWNIKVEKKKRFNKLFDGNVLNLIIVISLLKWLCGVCCEELLIYNELDWWELNRKLQNIIFLIHRFSAVCPQRLPDISNETATLERMPRGRLEYLKRLLPYLQNQSEDCLYLNIYAPIQGKCWRLILW